MKVLMIYPKYPDTFWSFKHALKFVSKKAAVAPLGLITVSAILPVYWHKKLVDLNVEELVEEDIKWADVVFLSGMYIQKESVNQIINRCKYLNKIIVGGGPLFTQDYEQYPQIDHFILNEAEITLPRFLADLELGNPLQRFYQTEEYADLSSTPVPDYHLLNLKAYAAMNIQVSRGCPFSCDFCEITALLGRKVRVKSSEQILNELETLYRLNWRGTVAVVDDNFIGNKKFVKNELLPSMIEWMKSHGYPFTFNAQTSINLADDQRLLTMMREAGFTSTFIGIETPDEESLQSCHKMQNGNRNMIENVKQIQKAGLLVSGGFIVGFDSDTSSVFQRQVEFIQQSGIVTAMVGLLNAPKHTKLYQQLKRENRLTIDATGSNTDFTMNFIPKMDNRKLQEGYQYIISNIYREKPYYKRIRELLSNYKPIKLSKNSIDFVKIKGFFKSVLVLGLLHSGRYEYWKFIAWTLANKPKLFINAITFAVYGYHFRKVYGLKHTQY